MEINTAIVVVAAQIEVDSGDIPKRIATVVSRQKGTVKPTTIKVEGRANGDFTTQGRAVLAIALQTLSQVPVGVRLSPKHNVAAIAQSGQRTDLGGLVLNFSTQLAAVGGKTLAPPDSS
jgi:hypothetical protein